MTDECRPLFHKLLKCLRDASECIEQLPDGNEFKAISVQLQSLKLIVDGNADALRLWMDDDGNYGRFQTNLHAA